MNESNPEQVLRLVQGFMESRIMLSAAELNLFTILKQTPMAASEIASRVGADTRALTILLDALVSMDLLVKQGQRYRCESSVLPFLVEGSPNSILPMVFHANTLWRRWSSLTDVVRGIGAPSGELQFSRNKDELRAFIGAMHVVAEPLAKRIVAEVDSGCSKSLIDVGGGSGSYTIAFLKAVPEMKATLFDIPEVIEMARERLGEAGLLDRTTLVAGDFHQQELPGGHDLALISAIIHANSLEQNLGLFEKTFRSLDSGGRILIRDHVMEPDRAHPKNGAVFAVNMLVGTARGGTYTYEEIEAGLTQAGFTGVRLLRQGERMDGLIEAFKP